jgi:hypothetical protein
MRIFGPVTYRCDGCGIEELIPRGWTSCSRRCVDEPHRDYCPDCRKLATGPHYWTIDLWNYRQSA